MSEDESTVPIVINSSHISSFTSEINHHHLNLSINSSVFNHITSTYFDNVFTPSIISIDIGDVYFAWRFLNSFVAENIEVTRLTMDKHVIVLTTTDRQKE